MLIPIVVRFPTNLSKLLWSSSHSKIIQRSNQIKDLQCCFQAPGRRSSVLNCSRENPAIFQRERCSGTEYTYVLSVSIVSEMRHDKERPTRKRMACIPNQHNFAVPHNQLLQSWPRKAENSLHWPSGTFDNASLTLGS